MSRGVSFSAVPVVKQCIEVRCLWNRRYKAWCNINDPSDPILLTTLHGSQYIPRKDIEWVNLEGDPMKQVEHRKGTRQTKE